MIRVLKSGLLLALLALCFISVLLAQQLRERTLTPAPRELFTVVNEQLLAFRAANFQIAYRLNAAVVQHRFTLGQFEKMVRQSYPEMVLAQRVEFGSVKMQGASALVQVFFFNPDNSVRSFLYSLIKEDDAWRIDGVQELRGYRSGELLSGTHA